MKVKRRIGLVAVVVALATLAAGVLSAAAVAAPAAVSIDLFPTQFCCPQEIGTWQATGAITDSGS